MIINWNNLYPNGEYLSVGFIENNIALNIGVAIDIKNGQISNLKQSYVVDSLKQKYQTSSELKRRGLIIWLL